MTTPIVALVITLTALLSPSHLTTGQQALWCLYLVAALMLPLYHIPPILKYVRGSNGIGDGCIRSEILQCCWRVPALLFAIFVAPSVPLFLSIFLDLIGRVLRVLAMRDASRRFERRAARATEMRPAL